MRDSDLEREPSVVLADLYQRDRQEHAAVLPVGTPEYNALRARDKSRRASAQAALASLRRRGKVWADDLVHAEWLFNHRESPAAAQMAHELASKAAKLGHSGARWLAAASFDRWCMYEGRPQRYGTQIVPDGKRHRLWDVDPSTTDANRAEWDVPPLADQLRRAEEMTARHPQPPMEQAPRWVKDATERWTAISESDDREAGGINERLKLSAAAPGARRLLAAGDVLASVNVPATRLQLRRMALDRRTPTLFKDNQ